MPSHGVARPTPKAPTQRGSLGNVHTQPGRRNGSSRVHGAAGLRPLKGRLPQSLRSTQTGPSRAIHQMLGIASSWPPPPHAGLIPFGLKVKVRFKERRRSVRHQHASCRARDKTHGRGKGCRGGDNGPRRLLRRTDDRAPRRKTVTLRTFSLIRVGTHLPQVGEERRMIFEGPESKSGRSFEITVPEKLVPPLEYYLRGGRPKFTGADRHKQDLGQHKGGPLTAMPSPG